VHQVGKIKDYHYIRMYGQQNVKTSYEVLHNPVKTVFRVET